MLSDTIIPDGLEETPPKYGVIKRNRWMIEQADTVITYVKHTTGGAARFREIARKKGRTIIDLAAETCSLPSESEQDIHDRKNGGQ